MAAHECGAFGSSFGPEPARRKKKRRQQCWVRTSLAAWAACKDSPRALPASVLCAHPPKTTKNLRWQNRVAWRCCGGACGAASCGSSGAGRARDAHGAEFGGRHGDARPRGSRRLRADVYVHLNRGGRGDTWHAQLQQPGQHSAESQRGATDTVRSGSVRYEAGRTGWMSWCEPSANSKPDLGPKEERAGSEKERGHVAGAVSWPALLALRPTPRITTIQRPFSASKPSNVPSLPLCCGSPFTLSPPSLLFGGPAPDRLATKSSGWSWKHSSDSSTSAGHRR